MRKPKSRIDVAIGDELKVLRQRNKLTLAEVAERMGCSRQLIMFYEKGIVSISVPQLIRICDIYNSSYIVVLEKVKSLVYTEQEDGSL